MTSATFSNPSMPQPVVRLRVGRILLALLLVLGALALGSYWVLTTYGKKVVAPVVETSTHPAWMKQPVAYAAADPTTVKPAVDPNAALLRDLQMQNRQLAADLLAQKEALESLRRRPVVPETKGTPPPKIVAPAPQGPPKKATAGPMLFVSNTVENKEGAGPQAHEYTLAPTTFLPCLVQTKIISDVEGALTCKITTNIYDTATGRHLLVPQGSTILGTDHANDLLYGSNRMNTRALLLVFPDGRSVELGAAPITDHQGVTGLVGSIDNHYFKLLGAVIIGGALKGGITAFQVAATEAAGAGQITSGLTTLGNQATTKVTQPHINIRPTITIEAGTVATVILLKPLTLAPFWGS